MVEEPSAWASVEDLEARWRRLTEVEQERAQVLIEDAQTLIMDECPRWQSAPARTLKRVVCAVVKRAMNTPLGDDSISGVSNTSITAGPYTQQYTFANPGGDLYLTKAERRAVNGQTSGIYSLDLLRHLPAGDERD